MQWQLPQSEHPAYLRVINLIESSINNGTLLPGTRLPAERRLAGLLGVNRSTIQRALAELVARGMLLRKVGAGTWVNPGKWGVQAPVAWHDYLNTNRLSGPEPYAVRLAALQHESDAIDLANSTVAADLALPISSAGLSLAALVQQEAAMDMTGLLELKQALIRQRGLAVSPQQVLITSGAQQAYYLIAQGLLSQGDAIAIEAPSYFYQLTLFQAAGIRVYGVPRIGGALDLEALSMVYHQHHVRFLFVDPTGQNPTGTTMSLAERQALLARCRSLQLPIVEDDLLGLVPGPKTLPALYQLDPQNVLLIGSLSSLIGPHARIGWLIALPGVVSRLAQIRQQMEAEISVFPQQLATQFLKQADFNDAVAHQQAQLAIRCQALESALLPFVAEGTLSFAQPQANNHLWVRLNVPKQLKVGDYQAFLQARVLLRPDWLFGTRENCVRMSFARFDPRLGHLLTARLATIFASWR